MAKIGYCIKKEKRVKEDNKEDRIMGKKKSKLKYFLSENEDRTPYCTMTANTRANTRKRGKLMFYKKKAAHHRKYKKKHLFRALVLIPSLTLDNFQQ